MTKFTKTLLGLSLTGLGSGLLFVTGTITVQDNVFLYVSLPAGTIVLGLFLISLFLEKEAARFDEEERMAFARATKGRTRCASDPGRCACAESSAKKPALASAH